MKLIIIYILIIFPKYCKIILQLFFAAFLGCGEWYNFSYVQVRERKKKAQSEVKARFSVLQGHRITFSISYSEKSTVLWHDCFNFSTLFKHPVEFKYYFVTLLPNDIFQVISGDYVPDRVSCDNLLNATVILQGDLFYTFTEWNKPILHPRRSIVLWTSVRPQAAAVSLRSG